MCYDHCRLYDKCVTIKNLIHCRLYEILTPPGSGPYAVHLTASVSPVGAVYELELEFSGYHTSPLPQKTGLAKCLPGSATDATRFWYLTNCRCKFLHKDN